MANLLWNSAKKKLIDGSIDLDTDTIKVALFTSTMVPNIDTQTFFSDISGEVVNGGYSAGGVALANKVLTVDTANDRCYLDADDVSITPTVSSIAVRYLVLYKSTGSAATSPLIGYIDFLTDRTASASDVFLIQWAAPASGAIFYLA